MITVEVGILYTSLLQVWRPLAEIGDFKKTGVLTLSFTTERGNRLALLERMWSVQNNDVVAKQDKAWWGEDIYYVGVLPTGDFFTTQIPENDEKIIVRSGSHGGTFGTIDCPRTFPADATMHRFIGGYVDPSAWEIALAIFERDMF